MSAATSVGERTTPQTAGFRQPAEWAPHEACWIAWPSHEDLWQDALEPVRSAWIEMARSIAAGERLEILVPDAEEEAAVRSRVDGADVRFHRIPFGDVWLRDTAPVFVAGAGRVASVAFSFNGWGGKYVLPGDADVSARIADAAGLPAFRLPFVLEGGAVEVDGEGTCLTTRQCLLNPNRNPSMTQADVEKGLGDALGVDRVMWLSEGLVNDHTDGHIDTLARFVAPGVVVCMRPSGDDDPNRRVLEEIERDLRGFRDAGRRPLDVFTLPSPGRVTDGLGRILPASYVNFYIANAGVVVPVYGSRHDDDAVEIVSRLFPGRRTIGIPARALLGGGGAFHCITQQQPAAR